MKAAARVGAVSVLATAMVSMLGVQPGAAVAGGTTIRVSVDQGGLDADGPSYGGAISSNGRWVAFASDATDIVAGDNNGKTDVFLRDLQTNTTVRVSVDQGGGDADGGSVDPSVSSNGRWVAFASAATDLIATDGDGHTDVFVRDLQKGVTRRISVNPSFGEPDGSSFEPAISADGRYVAFASDASNLVPLDSNHMTDIFVADRTTGAITLISRSGDAAANGASILPDVDADGSAVAFDSLASNLVGNDGNSQVDAYVWTRATGSITLASVGIGGVAASGGSTQASIDGAGTRVAFYSDAPDLITGDGNGKDDVFVRDLQAGTTERATVSVSGGTPTS